MKITTQNYDSNPTLTPDAITKIKSDVQSYVEKAISSMKKLKPYLYSIEYDYIDYDYAFNDYKNRFDNDYIPGACTSGRFGNFYARNLDWYYSENAEFIIRTKAHDGLYSSISVCQGIPDLTEEFANSRQYSEKYKMIPFYANDGMNEYGLVVNANVVPRDYPLVLNQNKPGRTRVCSLMLNRWVLDHYKTAKEAAEAIRDTLNVWIPTQVMNYEDHIMISDLNETYLVEFINNETCILNMTTQLPNRQFMTNFYIQKYDTMSGVGNPVSLIDDTHVNWQEITPHGDGVERYNLILKTLKNKSGNLSLADVKDLFRNGLKYSKSYQDWDNLPEDFWYTEYVDTDPNIDLTVELANTHKELFENTVRKSYRDFLSRTRDGKTTWITMHTSIFDMQKKKLYLVTQEENDIEYEFRVKEYYTAEEIDAIIDSIRNN